MRKTTKDFAEYLQHLSTVLTLAGIDRMPCVLIVGGTRPEGVKLAPVALRARSLGPAFQVRWVSTGQHPEMMRQALAGFGIQPDIELDVFSQGQSLNKLQNRVFESFDGLLAAERPD